MNKINFQNGTLVSKAKVTVGGTVYEVEPAEYEGTTPLNAENLNQIQTNAENSINTVQSNLNITNQNIENLTTYSTEEKVIGKWINEKPLYEKTIVATKTSGADLNLDITGLNIDVGFIAGGGLISTQGTIYNLDRYESGVTFTRAELSDRKAKFHYVSSSGNYTNGTVIAVIRYTKTTD